MANIPFSNLPVAPGLGGDEIVPIVQGGVDKRTTTQSIANLGGGGGGSITLTTNGNSGPATLVGDVLNVPVYGTPGGGNTILVTTAGPVSVGSGDGVVLINKGSPSATAISLPATSGRQGLPVQIVDWAGNGGAVTVTPDGGETIMGLSQLTLVSNGQGPGIAASITLYPTAALNGWYTAP